MVTIYSLEDFVAGRIPSPASGKDALAMFEQAAVLPYVESGEVLGGFAYGSVCRDDFTPASDVDYLLVVRDETGKERAAEAVTRVRERFFVDMNLEAMTLEEAQRGEHTIDEAFRQHLEHVAGAYGGVRGRNPLEIIGHTGISFGLALDMSVRSYLSKIRKEELDAGKGDDRRAKLIKTAVEKPFHTVRIALQWLQGSVAPKDPAAFSDSKSYLLDRYASLDPPAGSLEALGSIKAGVREYISLLVERTSGQGCGAALKQAYGHQLRSLERLAPLSRTFMQQNYRWLKGIKAAA